MISTDIDYLDEEENTHENKLKIIEKSMNDNEEGEEEEKNYSSTFGPVH